MVACVVALADQLLAAAVSHGSAWDDMVATSEQTWLRTDLELCNLLMSLCHSTLSSLGLGPGAQEPQEALY